jgi:hypothetical protein
MGRTVSNDSPRMLSRLTGALYLFIMVAAMFAEAFVRGKLVVTGDGAATVRNIASFETLWRWSVAANVSVTVADVAIAGLLFILLRPVNFTVAMIAAFFRLTYAAAMTANAVLLTAPLLLLGQSAPPLADPAQANFLLLSLLSLHNAAFGIALVVFGVHLILIGAFIARSKFLPRFLGFALTVAGACYLFNSFAGLVAPDIASRLFPWILLPGFLAEGTLALWLLTAGVNEDRWRQSRIAAMPAIRQ